MPRQYRRYFAKFYAYPDSDPTATLRAPWATSLRCHGALGVPPATLRRICCNATATCLCGDLTALVLSMFKTWRRPRRPWRPNCDLQGCHGALWDLTMTQRRSAAIWPIWQIAARSPSCVTGVLPYRLRCAYSRQLLCSNRCQVDSHTWICLWLCCTYSDIVTSKRPRKGRNWKFRIDEIRNKCHTVIFAWCNDVIITLFCFLDE